MAAIPQTACASGRFRPLASIITPKKTWIRELIYVQHVVYILQFEEHPIPIEHPLVVLDEFNIQLSIMDASCIGNVTPRAWKTTDISSYWTTF
jgi:hypothetical protein